MESFNGQIYGFEAIDVKQKKHLVMTYDGQISTQGNVKAMFIWKQKKIYF